MGVAATLFGVQHLKGIEQRRSGAAQWLPGPRSIGQKEFPFRTIKSLLLLLLFNFLLEIFSCPNRKFIGPQKSQKLMTATFGSIMSDMTLKINVG